MNNFRQDIIECLIFNGARSAIELGRSLDDDPEEIYDELKAMRSEGLVSNAPFEDVELGNYFDPDYDRPCNGDPDDLSYLCHRCDLVHPMIEAELCARWVYFGGAVSRALAAQGVGADA
ncbi:MAG: hypothetical protein ACJ741_11140 [Pyrinomonadaceae bacterium]